MAAGHHLAGWVQVDPRLNENRPSQIVTHDSGDGLPLCYISESIQQVEQC